jgi:hypothetical protein
MYTIVAALAFGAGGLYSGSMSDLFRQELPYSDGEQNLILQFQLDQTYNGPFYIYYRIEGLYQNHFLYSESKNWAQLRGKPYTNEKDLNSCNPAIRNSSSRFFVPCGAVSRSVFNDTFHFSDDFPPVYETAISMPHYNVLFNSPDPIYNQDDNWLASSPLFPGNQMNEHFINWERNSAFRNFPKLWGRTSANATLQANQLYNISIENNFPVSSFGGSKTLIIAQTMWLGARNPFIANFFFIIGGVALFGATLFLLAACIVKAPDRDSGDSESLLASRPLLGQA